MGDILTVTGQPKTSKGERFGWYTAVLHLAPADQSLGHGGFNTCPDATAQCKALCLTTAGRGGIPQAGRRDGHANAIQAARVRKTAEFAGSRERFLVRLAREIGKHARKARALGLRPAVRLNGTSDLAWESVTLAGRSLPSLFPEVRFYDYTKSAARAARQPYNLTFSRSENTPDAMVRALAMGGINVAVVFATKRGRALPKRWLGLRVIDGDQHDLRFKDARGVIVGLRAKGKARKHTGGFVVSA